MRGPFFREFWPVALLTLFGIFIFAPVLFFGRAFFGEEQIGFYYAISDYVRQSLASGTSLLWQSGYFGGVSASLDQFVGAWYPLNLFLFSVFGTFTAHHLSVFIATTLGLLFCYWFGRLEGWKRSSSVVLALGYLSATTYGWLQIGTIAAHSFAMLPALLVALHYATQKRTRLIAILGGGVALGVGFLAGFMQIVFYAYIVAGCYALFLDWNAYSRVTTWWRSLPVSLSFSGMTLLGLALGFRQFFPSAYLIDQTIRTSTYAAQNVTYPWPTELMTFVMPPYLSIPFVGGGSSAGFYVGVLGLVFAILGLIYYRTRSSLFFAALYACVAAVAFHLPIFGWLNEHIPPFSHMGGNFRWMLAAAFPLAYLSATGVEGFLRNPERVTARAYKVVLWCLSLLVGALVLGSIAVTALATAIASSPKWIAGIIAWYGSWHTLLYPAEHYHSVLEQAIQQVAGTFALSNPRFLFGALCTIAALCFFVALRWWPASRQHMSKIIVAVTVLAVGGTYALQWSDLVPQAIYAEKPALVSLLESREKDPHSYRIFGFLLGDGLFQQLTSRQTFTPDDATRLQHEILTNNVNLYFGIERMDGMEPYRTLRGNQLIHTVLGFDNAAYVFDDTSPALATSRLDQLYNRDVQKVTDLVGKLADFNKRLQLLSMMNVKYIYSPYQLTDVRLVPVTTIPLSVSTTTKLYVYENKQVLPRLYFAAQPQFFSGTQNELLQKVVAEKDFSKRTWIECGTCSAGTTSGGSVRVQKYKPGDVVVEATTSRGGWLVFSESYLAGWQAKVDGVVAPLYTANYLFQAVYVPAGTHEVSFVYQDVTVLQLEALFK